MKQEFQPFTNFVSGNHLVLGASGVGKSLLIMSLLQTNEFSDKNTINIVLSASSKHIYQYTVPNPIISIDPYSTNLNWISEPTVPGIYYCACDYLPRIVTFLECLANFTRGGERKLQHPIRLFIDIPPKFWQDESIIEQIVRLNYISNSISDYEFRPLTLWTVFTSLKELSPKAKVLLEKTHLVIIKPIPQSWFKEILTILEKNFAHLKSINDNNENNRGFFYLPYTEDNIYSQNQVPLYN
ncbi:MAG: hypothetical protein ACYDEJ_12870 [Desulfitobacteriaceae bacterium]